MVALPAKAISYTSERATAPSSHTSPVSWSSTWWAKPVNRPSASGSIMVALMRVITSAP